jgi:hypothetical protein
MSQTPLRPVAEEIARKTNRRGFFGRGAELLFGTLAGVAAGAATKGGGGVIAGGSTVCAFPGPPCPCNKCRTNGLCAKPCVILTTYYASGCWVTAGITCCDCDCNGIDGGPQNCGCGSDYHNNPSFCTEHAP